MAKSREKLSKGQYDAILAEKGEVEKELKDKEAEITLHKNDLSFLNIQLDKAR